MYDYNTIESDISVIISRIPKGQVIYNLHMFHSRECEESFTYYVITKEEGVRNYYANVIFALSNVEFDHGRGERVYKQTKSDYAICERPLFMFCNPT